MSYARNLARLARTGAPTVDTAQALRDLPIYGGLYPERVETLGALAAGDGGGGPWRWDAASTADEVPGLVILPTGHVGPGRWIGKTPWEINVESYGAKQGNDGAAFQRAANAAYLAGGGEIIIPEGDYYLDSFDAADTDGRVLWDTEFSSSTIPCVRIAGNTTLRGIGRVRLLFPGGVTSETYESGFAIQSGVLLSSYGTLAAFDAQREALPVLTVVTGPTGWGVTVADASVAIGGSAIAAGDVVSVRRLRGTDPDPNPASHPGIDATPIFRTPSREDSPVQFLTVLSVSGNTIYFREAPLHDFAAVEQLMLYVNRRDAEVRGIGFKNIEFATDPDTLSAGVAYWNVNQAFDIWYEDCRFTQMRVIHGTMDGVRADRCVFDDCDFVGFEAGHGVRVRDCTFIDRSEPARSTTGLFLNDSLRDAEVEGCAFHNYPKTAIWAIFGVHASIRDCLFVNCGAACRTPDSYTEALMVLGHVAVNFQTFRQSWLPLSGTWSSTAGSNAITGAGTKFLTEVSAGGALAFPGSSTPYTIASVESDTALTLATAAPATTSGNSLGCVAFLRRHTAESEITIERCRSIGPARTIATAHNARVVWRDCDFEVASDAGPWDGETAWAPFQTGESRDATGDATHYPGGHRGRWVWESTVVRPASGGAKNIEARGLVATNYGRFAPWRPPRTRLAAGWTHVNGVDDAPLVLSVNSAEQIADPALVLIADPTTPYVVDLAKGISAVDGATQAITLADRLHGAAKSSYTIAPGVPVGSSLGDPEVWSRCDTRGLSLSGAPTEHVGGWATIYSRFIPIGGWAGSTAYSVGAVVLNGGEVYYCVFAGTSAASGGPTGTGTGAVTDGTAKWRWLQTGGAYVGRATATPPPGQHRLDASALWADAYQLSGQWSVWQSAGATVDSADPVWTVAPLSPYTAWADVPGRGLHVMAADDDTADVIAISPTAASIVLSWRLSPAAAPTFNLP